MFASATRRENDDEARNEKRNQAGTHDKAAHVHQGGRGGGRRGCGVAGRIAGGRAAGDSRGRRMGQVLQAWLQGGAQAQPRLELDSRAGREHASRHPSCIHPRGRGPKGEAGHHPGEHLPSGEEDLRGERRARRDQGHDREALPSEAGRLQGRLRAKGQDLPGGKGVARPPRGRLPHQHARRQAPRGRDALPLHEELDGRHRQSTTTPAARGTGPASTSASRTSARSSSHTSS